MALFDIDPLLNAMLDTAPGISDLNLSVGRPPQVEIDGALRAVEFAGIQKLMPYHTELVALRLLQGDTFLRRDLDNPPTYNDDPWTVTGSPPSRGVHSVLPSRPLLWAINAEAAARIGAVER